MLSWLLLLYGIPWNQLGLLTQLCSFTNLFQHSSIFELHTNVIWTLLFIKKKSWWDFDCHCMKSIDKFGGISLLILIILTNDHDILLNLCVSLNLRRFLFCFLFFQFSVHGSCTFSSDISLIFQCFCKWNSFLFPIVLF